MRIFKAYGTESFLNMPDPTDTTSTLTHDSYENFVWDKDIGLHGGYYYQEGAEGNYSQKFLDYSYEPKPGEEFILIKQDGEPRMLNMEQAGTLGFLNEEYMEEIRRFNDVQARSQGGGGTQQAVAEAESRRSSQPNSTRASTNSSGTGHPGVDGAGTTASSSIQQDSVSNSGASHDTGNDNSGATVNTTSGYIGPGSSVLTGSGGPNGQTYIDMTGNIFTINQNGHETGNNSNGPADHGETSVDEQGSIITTYSKYSFTQKTILTLEGDLHTMFADDSKTIDYSDGRRSLLDAGIRIDYNKERDIITAYDVDGNKAFTQRTTLNGVTIDLSNGSKVDIDYEHGRGRITYPDGSYRNTVTTEQTLLSIQTPTNGGTPYVSYEITTETMHTPASIANAGEASYEDNTPNGEHNNLASNQLIISQDGTIVEVADNGTKLTRYPDKSTFEERRDGSTLTTNADGSTSFTGANGGLNNVNIDGLRINDSNGLGVSFHYADKSSLIMMGDGTRAFHKGSEFITIQPEGEITVPFGTTVIADGEGAKLSIMPSGSTITEYDSNLIVYEGDDREYAVFYESGTMFQQKSDGSTTLINADGTSMHVTGDGVEYTDGEVTRTGQAPLQPPPHADLGYHDLSPVVTPIIYEVATPVTNEQLENGAEDPAANDFEIKTTAPSIIAPWTLG